MSNDYKRECLACGEIHSGEICPIVKAKIEKIKGYNKKNFLMGNILLECIKNDVDILQTLAEIAEYNEEMYDGGSGIFTVREFLLDRFDFVDYFAASLGCSSREFYKSPEETIQEYYNIFKSETPDGWGYNDDNYQLEISASFRLTEYRYTNTYKFYQMGQFGYNFDITKKLKDNDCTYILSIDLPDTVSCIGPNTNTSKKYEDRIVYSWNNRHMWHMSSSKTIILAEDKDGLLKELFESKLDEAWTDDELVKECSFDDSRFETWLPKLAKATVRGLMEWYSYNNGESFSTNYDGVDIKININLNANLGDSAVLYVRNQEGGLGLRFGQRWYGSFREEIERIKKGEKEIISEPNNNSKIVELTKIIQASINYFNSENIIDGLPVKVIAHADVMVITSSMICHSQNHSIIPMRGKVSLLANDNKCIDYELYVGYCKECNKYYVFKKSYYEMIKVGKPLCAVYQSYEEHDIKKCLPFKYKSQSVLNAMGYTVSIESNLSTDERQEILKLAINSKLFGIHDLLKFFDWLIRTREPLSKYAGAVRRWKEDMKFVEEYQKVNRQIVEVDSITVK